MYTISLINDQFVKKGKKGVSQEIFMIEVFDQTKLHIKSYRKHFYVIFTIINRFLTNY